MLRKLACRVLCGLAAVASLAGATAWAEGLEAKGDHFPIAVWLQQPMNAEKYKAVGINLYIGLHRGPTEEQLAALEKAGMPVVCHQNAESLKERWNKLVLGWAQQDEPDNAQEKPGGGYGPPVLPEVVIAKYHEMKAADKLKRPVFLNLSMGVAFDGWWGRGTRTNKPEDYPEYVKAADILSFDIYPASASTKNKEKAYAGNLSYVGRGVKRLSDWVDHKKPVWTCIETTHIGNPDAMPTPKQVRDEVWMAIINGARGIVYFAHEFKPKFIEAGLLHYPEIAEAVKNVNSEVKGLARMINEGKAVAGASVDAKSVIIMAREHAGERVLFATGMEAGPIKASFTLPGLSGNRKLEVIGENRTVDSVDGKWTDTFTGYEAHLYRIRGE